MVHGDDANPYHGWEWLTWIAPLLSCAFVPLVVDRAGQPVGAVPLLLRRQLTVSSANIVPIPYLGPIVPSEVVQETTREVLRWARRRGVVRLELCLTPHANAPDQTMAAVGLAEERVETFMVDLAGRGESELFAAIGGQARTAVRRSERKGVTIRTATAEDLRTVLPAVHEEALGGPRPYAHRLGDALARAGIPVPARCATAVVDGEAIGVSITLAGCSAVGWLGSVHRSYRHTQASAALVWDAICWASAQGCASLDMGAAPHPGIAEYKRKFRPRIEEHLVGRWEAAGLVALRRLRHARDERPSPHVAAQKSP